MRHDHHVQQIPSRSRCGCGADSPGRVGSIAAALIAALALLSVAPSAQGAWYNTSWQYRKLLTIDYTKVGATLSSFPVLVSLASDADLAADAQDDGDDILFTSSDGTTKLDHEIELFNGTTDGRLVAWVRIPSLSNVADTQIYMYYGNGSATSQQNRTGVWNDGGSNYYKAVWHLNQSFSDSTSYANNGTDTGGTTDFDGKIANGRDFNGSSQYITVANSASLQIPDVITAEAWVYPDTANSWDTIVSKMNGQTENLYFVLTDLANIYVGLVPARTDWDTGYPVSAGGWSHVAVTYDGSNIQVYRNGSNVATSNNPGTLGTNTHPLYIGYNEGWTTEHWDGKLDEIRISRTARTATWISTEFNSQNNPGPASGAFFKSLGGEEQNLEQEGFRFRLDDGSESGATWLAAQDANISRDKNLNTRLRVLVNALSDPASTQYQLEYKKSTDSQWSKVLAAGGGGFPQVASITPSIFGTDVTAHNVAMPATVASGDLLLVLFTSDGNASVTTPAGWTLIETLTRLTYARGSVYAKVAAGNEGGTTVDFTTSATEQAAAQVYRILAADWYGNITDGIASASVDPGATTATPDPPSLNPAAWDVENTLWIAYAAGSSWTAVTSYPTNYTNGTHTISNTGTAGASASSARRESAAASEDPGTFTMTTTSSGVAFTIAIRPSAGGGVIVLQASTNIPASGANTTAQLTPPSGKTTANFTTGRIQDDENPADAVDIASNYYTELEWSLIATATAQYGDVYQFRVTANGVPLTTYTVTPQWTIQAGGDTSPPTPNPMTFATAPFNDSATQISMVATTASDPSTPVNYLFTNDNSGCGANAGTGGTSSSWQSSTSYSDAGLQPNKCYGYTVTARDSLLNTGTASSVSSTYTSAAVPGTPTLSGATATTLNLTNAENGNPSSSPTTYFAVQVVTTSPNDATWLNQWVNASGNPSATAVWLTDAQLDALVLQGLTSSTTYGVKVKARNQDGDETALSAEGQGTTLAGANLDQIHTRWRNDDGPEVNIRVNSGHTVYNSGGSLLNHVITTPPHSPGDVIYIAFAVDQVQTITWPTGFTGGQDDIEATATWGVAYKVAGASEPSTYTVSVGISERAVAIAWSTSNDGGIDANSTPNGGSGATATCNAATTTVANDLVFRMVATDNSVATVTHAPLTDYTMLDQVTLQSGASLSVQFTTQASIGSTGTADVTITSEEWGSATMAIRPAAGPAPATWAANQDTKLTGLAKGTPRRVRFEVSNEGGTASAGVTYQLQVAQTATCSSGTYTAVPTGTTDHWQIVGSSYITDGEATINMASGLTDESSTFIAGQLKDAGNTTSSITLNANEFTEIEFAVQATTNATDGANYCFRLTNNGAALTTYDKYAEATLAAAPANLDQIHTRWRNDDGGEASGAIVVDATRSGSGTTTPLTISHPTGSGANRLMLVGVSINNDNLETVSSITYNGVGLTFVGYANNTRSGNDDARVEIWQLVAPPSGTYNVIINFSAAPALGAIVGVMTFAGVDQSTPLGTFAANENDGYTATVDVTSASNELVFGVVGTEYGTITTDPGQTERWNINIPTPDTHGAGSTKAGAAGSVTLTWALDTSLSNHWAAAGISIKPASASGATWAANEDTKLTGLAKSTLKRVRLEVSNEGGLTSGGVTYQLQVAQTSTCGSGTYSAVPTDTSGHWQIVGSTYITDGEATSNIAGGLTDEAATFVAGQLKDAGNTTGSITLAADAFTEIEFAVQATTNATDGANYCFRLYNTTGGAPLTTYSMYAEATLAGGAAALTLGNHFLWQVTNRFNTASPVTDVLFRFNLVRAGTVTVTNLRVNFTTSTGVANGDVTSGELYEDTNNNGLIDDGAAIQTGVTPVGGVLTFTTDFSPGTSGTNYLVRATVANLVVGDTTTFSVGPADIDEVEAGVGEAGSISGATHTRISVSSLYRSVGTTVTALASGTSNGLTISGSTATFDSGLPSNVGVGDAIQYDSDNNGSIDAIVFIHGRTSSTVYTVKNSAGGAPTATAAKDNDWAIYRAYTTLSNWESQSANSNIDAAVRSQVNPSVNLVTADSQLNVACYGDGPDTTAVTINGWTTGATTYINIFSPYLPSEVGATQRHSGTWDDTKYRLSAAPAYQSGVLEILEDFVRVEGLQILAEATANTQTDGIGAHCDAIATVSDIRIADNIVRAGGSLGSDAWGIGIWSPSAGGNSPTIRIWNNVVYDFTCSSCAGIGVGSQSTPTAYTYNNTVYNCSYGYYADSGGTIVAKNNIAYNNSDNYSTNSGTFSAASTNNLSGPSPQNDAPGSSPRNAVPVTFVAPGATPRDLHLVSTDTGAKDYGASLSSDPSLAFSDDIDSHSRPYGAAWDIGADEYVSGLFDYRRQITVRDAMTPATCGSDLSSFPVLVSISNDAGLKTAANGGHVANANGYDILFRALDGTTELDHEIESFDGSTGTLVAWVSIPTLVYSGDTTIYMYYGNAGITLPTANPAGVWGTSYKGVWHLKESGNSTAGEYDDSSQYANDGQGGRGDSRYVPKQTGGQIGFGQQFDNLVDGKYDLIDVGNGPALNITGNQITLEAWVRHDLSAPYAHDSWGFVNRKGWSSGYRLLMQTSGYGCAPLCVHFGLGEGSSFLGTATVLTAGSWHHVVGTYDGSLMRVFIDGVQDANTLSKTAALMAPLPPEDHVWIGYGDQPTDVGWSSEWVGQIDEVRISNVARSACWIETEYNSVQYATNSSYISVGAEGAAGPTAVDLVSLDATAYAGRGVLVSWRTGFEVDNLGFHVYRDQGGERVRVTPSLVAGSALFAGVGTALTAGQSYSWWDVSPVAGASYWLEEWELSGVRRWHGPVAVQPGVWHAQAQGLSASTSGGSVQGSSPLLAGLGQAASPSLPQGVRRKLRQAVASDEARLAVQWGLASRPAVKVMVSEAGWYRVSQEELVRAGLDPGVDPGSLQLFMDGREVPILVAGGADGGFGAGDGIEFYGEGLETCASGVQVYWLVAGPGAGMRIPEASGGGGWSQGPASFAAEVERADRTLYFPAFLNGEESNFFGAVVTASPVNQTVRVPHVEQAGPGELIVRLVGGTAGAHRVGVELNEVRVGTVVWEGMTVGELAVPVGPGMILEGDNTVTLTAEGGEGDVSAVASIAVRYAHTWQADGDALEFTLGGYQEVTISGFANSQVRVLDITDPWAVQMLPAEVSEDTQGTTVTVGVPEAGERTLLAVGTGAIRHPVGVLPNRPSAWHQATEGADLVIIGHRSLLAAVEPLRSLRESQGLKVAVVDVESVFDEFSYGARDPQAIRAFLACAKERWSRPPRYLLLVGDASFDPRNYLGYGWADLVPTKLVDTTYMETASDDWFADFDGDGIADIPIGRIPVQIASEATTAIGKIVAYDGSARFGRVLLLADANDEENDFEGLSAQVKAAVPSTVWVSEIFRGQVGDAAAKSELASYLNLGQTVINYLGHGSVAVWHGNWLTTDEARALRNYWYPFVVSMTCLNGYFHEAQQESLAEALLEGPGGAVAVWASSGLTESASQVLIDEALMRALFSGTTTLGDATRAAKAATSDMDVRRTWILFGDPTTKLR